MAYKQKTELNEEQITSFLTEIVEKIRTEEDPLELNVYRSLFRKSVPFTLRSYFAAYLLKQYFAGNLSGKHGISIRNDRSGKNVSKGRNDQTRGRQEDAKPTKVADSRRNEGRQSSPKVVENRQTEPRTPEVRPVLADDVSTTLFISIGRNRRVYPRDLIGLIMQNVEIDRDHVGEIRVLDNYSFVQVITEDAEKIINTLNEFEYRGRKLAVSYSRKREEASEGDSWKSESDSGAADSYKSETNVSDDQENNSDIQ